MTEILLIHDISDVAAVDRLADEITKAGVTVAKLSTMPIDFGLIAAARAVVVVWSPRSAGSDVVRAWAQAADGEGKLITLRTHDLDPAQIAAPFRRLASPPVDAWDAIGEAISAMFEAPAGDGRAKAQEASANKPQAAGGATAVPAQEVGHAIDMPAPVAIAEAAPMAQAATAVAPAAAPPPMPAAASPPPAPVAAPPSPFHQREGIGAAASAPSWRPEGVGAASDGPSILDKAWRLERDLGGEHGGTSIRFGKPAAPKMLATPPPSLSVYDLQQARGAATPASPEIAPGASADVDTVDCSVFAPPAAQQGTRVMVQVYLHRIEQAERAQFLATMMDDSAKLRGVETLHVPIPRRTWVHVELDGRGLKVSENVCKLYWNGEPTVASFEVDVPVGFDAGACHPVVRLLVDGEPAGRILFQMRIEAPTRNADPLPAPELGGARARNYQNAFLSYASKDRAEVLKRAQAFQAAKLTFFQDVLSLEPGQRYADEILRRIDGSDLFVVFWSRNAMRSEWVQKEIDKALACQRASPDGLPDIVPIMLEPLAKAPPPPALAHLHMNAPINTLIAAEQTSLTQRIRKWLLG